MNGVTDADQLRMFLHSDALRWSAGGIKGRAPVDDVGALASLPVPSMLSAFRDLGVCGVVFDRAAFADGGSGLLEQLVAITGIDATAGRDAFSSDDERFVYVRLPA